MGMTYASFALCMIGTFKAFDELTVLCKLLNCDALWLHLLSNFIQLCSVGIVVLNVTPFKVLHSISSFNSFLWLTYGRLSGLGMKSQ